MTIVMSRPVNSVCKWRNYVRVMVMTEVALKSVMVIMVMRMIIMQIYQLFQ